MSKGSAPQTGYSLQELLSIRLSLQAFCDIKYLNNENINTSQIALSFKKNKHIIIVENFLRLSQYQQNKSDITLSDFLFNEINLTELSEITADKNIEITKIKTQFRNLLDNFFSSLKNTRKNDISIDTKDAKLLYIIFQRNIDKISNTTLVKKYDLGRDNRQLDRKIHDENLGEVRRNIFPFIPGDARGNDQLRELNEEQKILIRELQKKLKDTQDSNAKLKDKIVKQESYNALALKALENSSIQDANREIEELKKTITKLQRNLETEKEIYQQGLKNGKQELEDKIANLESINRELTQEVEQKTKEVEGASENSFTILKELIVDYGKATKQYGIKIILKEAFKYLDYANKDSKFNEQTNNPSYLGITTQRLFGNLHRLDIDTDLTRNSNSSSTKQDNSDTPDTEKLTQLKITVKNLFNTLSQENECRKKNLKDFLLVQKKDNFSSLIDELEPYFQNKENHRLNLQRKLSAELSTLKSQLGELETKEQTELSRLRSKVSELEGEKESINAELARQKEEISQLKTKQEELTKETMENSEMGLEDERAKLIELENKVRLEFEEKLAQEQDELERKAEDLRELRKLLEADYKEKLENLEKDLESKSEMVRLLEEKNAELEAKLEGRKSWHDLFPDEIESPNTEYEKLNNSGIPNFENVYEQGTTVKSDDNPASTGLTRKKLFTEKTKSEARFSLPKVLELSGESCKYLKGEVIKINRNPLRNLESKKKEFEEIFLSKVKEEFKDLGAEGKINSDSILAKEIRELSNNFFDSGHFSILGTITKEENQVTSTTRIITESDMSLSSNDEQDRRYYHASFTKCDFNQTENSEPNIFGNANLFMANFSN